MINSTSHIGIHGNNEAEMATKSAIYFEIVNSDISSTDHQNILLNSLQTLSGRYFGTFVIQVNFIPFKI